MNTIEMIPTEDVTEASGEENIPSPKISRAFREKPMTAFFLYVATSVWLLPRNISIGIMKGYRKFISPLYGDVCRYYPTCSDYTLQTIQNRGIILGVILGSWRILRCNPWNLGGIDKPRTLNTKRYWKTSAGFIYFNPDNLISGA